MSELYIFKGREADDGRNWEEIAPIGGYPVEFTRDTHETDAANFARQLLKVSTYKEIRINKKGSQQGYYFSR